MRPRGPCAAGKENPLRDGNIDFRQVNLDRWSDLERLFESRGGPKYCWCMVWRSMPGASRGDRHAKKEALRSVVRQGTPIGILGYLYGEPVAWCSVAPRDSYRNLGGPTDGPGSVWSIACFFVSRRLRGKGMTRLLIGAAVEHARRGGAAVIEAYPVEPDSPSYRFMGLVGTFESMGFRDVGRAGSRRHVVRLSLQSPNRWW